MQSIVKKVELNNTEQYIIICGQEKKKKPVMLFLHGGPGFPELFTMQKEMSYLQDNFVMVYWEQRGAGKSYRVKELSLRDIILDTLELTKWLINNYFQEKIYIMGHSWGTFLGLLVVKKCPYLYHTYIGIGQVTNQYKAEKESLDWIRAKAYKLNDKKIIEKLSKLTIPDVDAPVKSWSKYLNSHRGYLWKYGGSFVNTKGVLINMLKNFIFFREYSLLDKIKFLPSAFFSLEKLWYDVVSINLFDEVKKVEVPIFIFQGKHDYQVSYTLAKEFIFKLEAPSKTLITFENSAHSPHIEENKKFNNCIKSILESESIKF